MFGGLSAARRYDQANKEDRLQRPATARQDAGWVQVFELGQEATSGRGHLFVQQAEQADGDIRTQPTTAVSHTAEFWEGTVDALTLTGAAPAVGGRYALRVERSHEGREHDLGADRSTGQSLEVEVTSVAEWASGLLTIAVRGVDGLMPSNLLELGGE